MGSTPRLLHPQGAQNLPSREGVVGPAAPRWSPPSRLLDWEAFAVRWQGIPSAWSQRPPEQCGPRTNVLAFTTEEDPEGPQGPPPHSQKLAPALLPSLSWATPTWNPPPGQLVWPETSRPLELKSSDCPCLTSTPETHPRAGLASPSAVQGEQQQRRWGKGGRHIAPHGRGACTGHAGRGPAPVPRPPTVARAGGRASRAARGHAILNVGSW